jgi:hypothetical protein
MRELDSANGLVFAERQLQRRWLRCLAGWRSRARIIAPAAAPTPATRKHYLRRRSLPSDHQWNVCRLV